jgi:hypothetical protein
MPTPQKFIMRCTKDTGEDAWPAADRASSARTTSVNAGWFHQDVAVRAVAVMATRA